MKKIIISALIMAVLMLTAHTPAHCGDFRLLCGNLMPLNFKNAQGRAEGIAVDILQKIMERTGNFMDAGDCLFEPWARAVRDLEGNPNAVLLSMAMTTQRRPLYKWVGPVYRMKLGLIARKNRRIRIENPEEIGGYLIGVVRDSGPEQILLNDYGVSGESLQRLARDSQQFGMLEQGRVDLVTHTDLSSPPVLEALGMDPAEYEMVYVLRDIDLYFAFNPEADDALIDRLQRELNFLKMQRADGTSFYTDILSRHLRHGPLVIREPLSR